MLSEKCLLKSQFIGQYDRFDVLIQDVLVVPIQRVHRLNEV